MNEKIEKTVEELYVKIEELMSLCMENEDYEKYTELGDIKEKIFDMF